MSASTFSQTQRLLRFQSPLGPDVLLIESFSGHEGMSQLFEYETELLAESGYAVDPVAMVGAKVSLGLDLLDIAGTRYFHGMVATFEKSAGDKEFDTYRARIVPTLWQATLSSNCRTFQDMAVMDVVRKVLEPYSVSISDVTQSTWPAMEYCTQYHETDFHFISRLLEQYGIFYWFEHSESDHVIKFGNSLGYSDCRQFSTPYYAPQAPNSEESYGSIVQRFTEISSMVTSEYERWDYDFRNVNVIKSQPHTRPHALGTGGTKRFVFLSSGEPYVKRTDTRVDSKWGSTFVDAHKGKHDISAVVYSGTSNVRTFETGCTFSLSRHPTAAWNTKYLLKEIVHQAKQSPSYRSKQGNAGVGYSNGFNAIRSDVLFWPPITAEKPRVHGPQTAKVVVPTGEEQYIDKYGRVSVQFFWDQARNFESVDNTWVRVSQPWAGNGWGLYFWPRKGDEVIVNFIDGDPDNPIIIGSVYNGNNLPKYDLPGHSTRSGILTRTTKNGGESNANELRFEDKEDSEQIFLNAERDMDHRIEHDYRTAVGNDQHFKVEKRQLQRIGGDKHETIDGKHLEKIAGQADRSIGGDLNEKIGGSHSLQVVQNNSIKVGQVYVVDSGQEIHLKGGAKVVIESGADLCISGPGGFITIDSSGITIQGMLVKINSGGAQVQGTDAQIQDPEDPTEPDVADDGTKGGRMA